MEREPSIRSRRHQQQQHSPQEQLQTNNDNNDKIITMNKLSSIVVSLLCIFMPMLLHSPVAVTADAATASSSVEVDENGNVMTGKGDDKYTVRLVEMAQEVGADLPLEEAIEISEMMKTARNDAETQALLQQMKVVQKEHFEELVKESTTEMQLFELRKLWKEMKMLESLRNADPEKVLQVMSEEGLVPEDHLKDYKKDPSMLLQDTLRGYYFAFISVSAAADFL